MKGARFKSWEDFTQNSNLRLYAILSENSQQCFENWNERRKSFVFILKVIWKGLAFQPTEE